MLVLWPLGAKLKLTSLEINSTSDIILDGAVKITTLKARLLILLRAKWAGEVANFSKKEKHTYSIKEFAALPLCLSVCDLCWFRLSQDWLIGMVSIWWHICLFKMIVVYFDQRLGAAHSKGWLKYAFLMCFMLKS